MAVCSDSGLLPSEACSHDLRGSRLTYGWFAKNQIPTKTCDTHMLVDWDSTTGRVATPYCPDSVIMRVALIKTDDRNFVQNIPITDARYTCRSVAGNPANVLNPSDPYYMSAMPAGTYAGYSPGVDAPQNSYCTAHNFVYPTTEDDWNGMDEDSIEDLEDLINERTENADSPEENHTTQPQNPTTEHPLKPGSTADNTESHDSTTVHPLH